MGAGLACVRERARRGRCCRVLSFSATCAALLVLSAAPLDAQYPDARLVPRGVLRVSFEPSYLNFGERFNAAGDYEPLGTDLSDSAAGVRLFPTLDPAQRAVWSLTGDSAYAMSLGAMQTTLDADIRRFPLNFQFGLSGRLTVTASLPFVTTRAQVAFDVDSTGANVGLNQVGSQSAALQMQALFTQLEAAAQYVEAQIALGAYGCPSSAACDDARAVVARTRALALDLTALAGMDASGALGAEPPPFAPLATSQAGLAVAAAIADLAADLQALGATPPAGGYPLPSSRLGEDAVNDLLADPVFGYGALPIGFAKYKQKLGDVAVGLRYGLAQRESFRIVLAGTVRLPTGSLDSPDHFTDIGSGDRQTDVEFGIETAWQAGAYLALAAEASYNLQLGHTLVRRVTPHTSPVAPLSTRTTVERNLGDVLRLALYPSLRLSSSFVAYGSATYVRKAADRFALTAEANPALQATALEFETAMRTWSFGGGIAYHAARDRSGDKLPIEAGVDYRAVFSGSGGQTPKSTALGFYLRLFWRLFGKS